MDIKEKNKASLKFQIMHATVVGVNEKKQTDKTSDFFTQKGKSLHIDFAISPTSRFEVMAIFRLMKNNRKR